MTSFLHGLRRLYSLETLDTRFTVASSTPAKAAETGQSAKDARAQAIAQDAQPPKWRTPEFYFYYLVFLTVVPMMFKSPSR